jgi:hypothetical protein
MKSSNTSSIVLTRSGESGHLCFFPDLRGKAKTFSLLSMKLTIGLSYMAFILCRGTVLLYLIC